MEVQSIQSPQVKLSPSKVQTFPLPQDPSANHNQPHAISTHPNFREECLQLMDRLTFLESKLSQLERRFLHNSKAHLKRKSRRRNEQIQKSFKCLVSACGKVYGSSTSLKLHMRGKHNIRLRKKRQVAEFTVCP